MEGYMATINQAMAHKPCDNEYELYWPLFLNFLALLWWMAIANIATFAVKLKLIRA